MRESILLIRRQEEVVRRKSWEPKPLFPLHLSLSSNSEATMSETCCIQNIRLLSSEAQTTTQSLTARPNPMGWLGRKVRGRNEEDRRKKKKGAAKACARRRSWGEISQRHYSLSPSLSIGLLPQAHRAIPLRLYPSSSISPLTQMQPCLSLSLSFSVFAHFQPQSSPGGVAATASRSETWDALSLSLLIAHFRGHCIQIIVFRRFLIMLSLDKLSPLLLPDLFSLYF